jgi:hypothetical protein
MSAESATLAGRRAAEAGMVDACTITREVGRTTDPDTGVTTKTLTQLYSGKCRVQQPGRMARPEQVGEAQVYQLLVDVQLPMSVTGLAVGDVVTITASSLDGDLVGRHFWLKDLAHKSHMTARRVGCEEVTS